MTEQKFFCEGCGLKSSVFYPKHEGVTEVVYRLESRHNRLSPDCTVQVRQLRVVNDSTEPKRRKRGAFRNV